MCNFARQKPNVMDFDIENDIKKEYFFYTCQFEGRQLCIGDTGFLAASDVVSAICDGDFQKYSYSIYEPPTSSRYYQKYAKRPKEGLFLLKVAKGAKDPLSVLIDTRLFPNFVMVEKVEGRHKEGKEVLKAAEAWLNQAAYQYGWHVKLRENLLNVVHHVGLFFSAMYYGEDSKEYEENVLPKFVTFIKHHENIPEIMALLHAKLDNKTKPKPIMRILRAAYDAGLIEKPEYDSFIKAFDKTISMASYYRYMTENENPLADDRHYNDYLLQFKKEMKKLDINY